MTQNNCHCGKDGHAINSVNCPEHGYILISKKWLTVILQVIIILIIGTASMLFVSWLISVIMGIKMFN